MARNRDHSHYEQLKNKWIVRHRNVQKNLWTKHKDSLSWFANQAKHAAVGSLAGMLFLTNPAQMIQLPTPPRLAQASHTLDTNVFLVHDLSTLLPKEIRPLTNEENDSIADLLSNRFGIQVKPELAGIRLNRTYGLIGQEQHLTRYQGDTIESHFDIAAQRNAYANFGMAAGRGAWGYFASSREALTEKDTQREKYYIAVQTFLSDNYNNRLSEYRDFFQFRKMLVVNTQNGKAIVADIGDSGPGETTGKHLGGSPEVMGYLERKDGAEKGPVLYFFIDDPNDLVPLGPITIQ